MDKPPFVHRYSCGCAVDPKYRRRLEHIIHLVACTFYRFYVFYPITGFFSLQFERICRAFAYGKFMYLKLETEPDTIFSLMEFHFKRTHHFLDSGMAEQTSEDMNALRRAIGLCKFLAENKYEDEQMSFHYDNWLNSDGSAVDTTPELHEQRKKEFFRAIEFASQQRINHIDRLSEILKNHSLNWWN